jgi:hypothetical protein
MEELMEGKGQLMNGCKGRIETITIYYYTAPD